MLVTSNFNETNLSVNNHQINSRISPWVTNISYFLGANIILPFYFGKITITGQENIPKSGAVMVAPTHKARWDALLVPYAIGKLASGRDLHFMVASTEMTGLQGWILSRLGGFPVNTKHPGLGSLRHSFELLCQDEMIVIFPEGGIFRDEKVHKLKPGVARIALEVETTKPNSGIKILPVTIKYSQTIPTKNCDVEINIGLPLNVADYNSNSLKKDTVKLTKDLEHILTQLCNC
jgi:1-acyl-sn-glycerol-3-phosphate acyltransferase